MKPSTASLRVTSKPSSLLVSSPTRQLPPIPHSQSHGAADQLERDGQLTGMVLNQCKEEVEESMKHLLFEVSDLLYMWCLNVHKTAFHAYILSCE